MAKYRKYSKEFKLQAAKLVTEQGYSYQNAAKRFGTTTWSIRNWVQQFRQNGELPAQNETQPKADELRQLRKEVAHLKMENDILKKNGGVLCKGVAVKYAWIKRHKKLFPIKRKYVVTTNSDHALVIAENILNRNFTADKPNHKWAADITYIPTKMGWLYLAVVMDLFSRRIVGWSMSDTIDSVLVQSAMKIALADRRPSVGLIHHSDRGVQYASGDFQDLLDDNKVTCSMSRKGNCWDNACVESFFGSLKNEWVKGKIYKTFDDAKKDIFNYIEMFYNRKRRHASLGYVSPVVYEEMHEMKQKRAA